MSIRACFYCNSQAKKFCDILIPLPLGKASRPGFEPGLKALRAYSAPQASGMSTTPSGQQMGNGMLHVIKPVGLTYVFGLSWLPAKNRFFEIPASKERKSRQRTHFR